MSPITKKPAEKKPAGKKTSTVKPTQVSEEKLKKDKTVTLKNSKTVAKESKSSKIDKPIKDKKLQTTDKNSKTVVKSSKITAKDSKIIAKGSKSMAKDSKNKTVASKAVVDKVKKDTKSTKVVENKEKKSSTKVDSKKIVDKKATIKSSKPTKETKTETKPAVKATKQQSTITNVATPKTVTTQTTKEKKVAGKSVETDTKVKKTKKDKESNIDFIISTTLGNIDIRLFPDKAPITVSNFLRYIAADYYNNTVFHRIIRGFMIQGGGYDKTLSFKEDTLLPIKIESNNGLKNLRGTIAMARTSDPHSATSQFFINLTDNPHLDFAEETIERYGYTVFAKVTKGLDIVDKIGNSPITTVYHHQNVPATPITIKSITSKVK